jgi:hypothetical protein
MDNFPQAVWASVIAKLHVVAGLQGPFGESLGESSRSNGSDFHTPSSWTGLLNPNESAMRGPHAKSLEHR